MSEHARALAFVREAVRAGRVTAVHDVSEGGVACALAEMAIAGGVGARCDLDSLIEALGASGETALFGEGPGGYLLAGPFAQLEALASEAQISFWIVGTGGGSSLELSAAEAEVFVPLDDTERAWRSLGERFES
jgi:phosphoribosylformylglycinamidine synthase